MRPSVLVFICVAPSAVWAQSTLEIVLNQSNEPAVIGPNDCATTVRADWTRLMSGVPCTPMRFWVEEGSGGSCRDEPGSAEVIREYGETDPAQTGNFEIDVDTDLFVTDAGTCGVRDTELSWKVCGSIRENVGSGCTPWVKDNSPPTIRYDALPPGVPAISRVEPLDSALSLTIEADEDTDSVVIRVSEGEGGPRTVTGAVDGPIVISNLTNGTTYRLTAQARDLVGNESAESEPVTGTPVQTAGFFQRYVTAGGDEAGGCATAGGALGPWAGVALGALVARRRRAWR